MFSFSLVVGVLPNQPPPVNTLSFDLLAIVWSKFSDADTVKVIDSRLMKVSVSQTRSCKTKKSPFCSYTRYNSFILVGSWLNFAKLSRKRIDVMGLCDSVQTKHNNNTFFYFQNRLRYTDSSAQGI